MSELAEAIKRCGGWIQAVAVATGVALATFGSPLSAAATEQVVGPSPDLTRSASNTLQQGAVLVCRQAGGLLPAAAAVQEWAIFSDGRVQASSGEVIRIDPQLVSKLVSDVTNLKVDGTSIHCRDCFTYHLELRRESRVKRFTVVEGGAGAPTDLVRRIDMIRAALDGARAE